LFFFSLLFLIASAFSNPHLLDCISSWTREIPSSQIVKSPLLDAIINALSLDLSFEAAVDCMCTLYRETRDVDESMEVIQILYPRLLTLRPLIKQVSEEDDSEKYKSATRLFSEAGEAWVILVARLPNEFRSLVEAVLECCARDKTREAIAITFYFWSDLKQYITIDKHAEARQKYADLFDQLVDVMIKHLEFPTVDPSITDLFDGDREQEENFRHFRHKMGDVLKDCCEVLSVTQCLNKTFDIIKNWIATYASQATATLVPHWQKLEAPLFAIRAMGRMVSPEESQVLHQLIPLIVQIPDHEKLRFQAVMALGRYTEWTAQHPDFLQVKEAAALAFRFFGSDCSKLLKGEVQNLHGFYDSVLDQLLPNSQEEITEGVSYVVAAQSKENIYSSMKLYCDPIVQRLKVRANEAQSDPENKLLKERVAGKISFFFLSSLPLRFMPSSPPSSFHSFLSYLFTFFSSLFYLSLQVLLFFFSQKIKKK
jgi:transportin-3